MATVYPYLTFQGNTEEAFNFYKSVFGGEFITVLRFKDMPENDKLPASEREKIMHISMSLGKNSVLMASDTMESMGPDLIVGNNFSLSIIAESVEDADKLFNGLSVGGEITMPIANVVWGAYFGMVKDKFGILWGVNYDYNQK